MLSVLISKERKELWELLDVSVTFIGDSITGVWMCPTSSVVHINYVQFFVYPLYLHKAVKRIII